MYSIMRLFSPPSLIDFEVVVYEGIIREKPSSKEEAWDFIKGLFSGNVIFFFSLLELAGLRQSSLYVLQAILVVKQEL